MTGRFIKLYTYMYICCEWYINTVFDLICNFQTVMCVALCLWLWATSLLIFRSHKSYVAFTPCQLVYNRYDFMINLIFEYKFSTFITKKMRKDWVYILVPVTEWISVGSSKFFWNMAFTIPVVKHKIII